MYNLDDLIKFDKAYFYGCLKRKKDVLTKKPITENDYFYAKLTKNGEYEDCDSLYSRAKILIKVTWVYANVTKFIDAGEP